MIDFSDERNVSADTREKEAFNKGARVQRDGVSPAEEGFVNKGYRDEDDAYVYVVKWDTGNVEYCSADQLAQTVWGEK